MSYRSEVSNIEVMAHLLLLRLILARLATSYPSEGKPQKNNYGGTECSGQGGVLRLFSLELSLVIHGKHDPEVPWIVESVTQGDNSWGRVPLAKLWSRQGENLFDLGLGKHLLGMMPEAQSIKENDKLELPSI